MAKLAVVQPTVSIKTVTRLATAANLKPSPGMAVGRGMTDDPDRHSLPSEDLTQLRAQAAVSSARTRELIEQLRELQARTTSLHAGNARLRDEVCFLKMALRKMDRFP